MNLLKTLALPAMLLACTFSCKPKSEIDQIAERVFALAESQLTLLDSEVPADKSPKSIDAESGDLIYGPTSWWCSGFLPGSLWYTYEYTGNEEIKKLAVARTLALDSLKVKAPHHDIGFIMNCSFGNALRLTGDESYREPLVTAAGTLCKRFSPVVGCTMSWNPRRGWKFPVIIDNMMNLELLMNVTELTADTTYSNVACTHARTTMKNHYRPDYSTWHVVDYDPETGIPASKVTHQGFSDDSAWSRGQAWSLYGFTMMYDKSRCPEFLDQAEHVAEYLFSKLPENGMPAWDFDCNDGTEIQPDASACSIMASAFCLLSTLTQNAELAAKCKAMALTQIKTLTSPEFLYAPGEAHGFLVKHCVGSYPANSEVDVPLTYADYYLLEAILRYQKIQ